MPTRSIATEKFPPIAYINALRIDAEPEFKYEVVPQAHHSFTRQQVEELKRLLRTELGQNPKITTRMTRQSLVIESRPADKFNTRSKYPTLTALIKLLNPKAKYVAFGLATNHPESPYTWITVGILGVYRYDVIASLRKKIAWVRGAKGRLDVPRDPLAIAVGLSGSVEAAGAALRAELFRYGISLTVYSLV